MTTGTRGDWVDRLLTPDPVPRPIRALSDSLRLLLVQQFTPDDLRHLAALIEANTPRMRARRRLSDASIDELAEMLVNGRTPTIGWWKRAA